MQQPSRIEVAALTKIYPRRLGALDVVRAVFGGGLPDGRLALDGLSLAVPAATTLGVIGRNGSGKSTLLRLIAGVLSPSRGRVAVHGRVAALLDLVAGIDPDVSGQDNALLLGMLAGGSRSQMRERLDAVREFSGLGDAFALPVQSYSTGMVLRLAFSTAVHADPDILLIDEVLAVGDAFFQQRCLLRVRQLQQAGCTIVLVTHDPAAVVNFCDRAIWLEHGRIAAEGDPAAVVRAYLAAGASAGASLASEIQPGSFSSAVVSEVEPAVALPNVDHRYGDGRARIVGISLRDTSGRSIAAPQPEKSCQVVITVQSSERIEHPIVGFTLRNRLGDVLAATNTSYEACQLPALRAGEGVTVEFTLRWPKVSSGSFSLSPAIADGDLERHTMCDWVDNAVVFEVVNPAARYGWLQLEQVGVRCAHHPPVHS